MVDYQTPNNSWRHIDACSCNETECLQSDFLLDRNCILRVNQCDKCYRFSYERIECSHENKRIAIRTYKNGGTGAFEQCLDCGETIGGAIKQDTIPESEKPLPDLIPIASGEHNQYEIIDALETLRKHYMSEEGKRKHDTYLKSDKWKRLRAKILERDRFLCQGCLTERATEVHHYSYDNLGDEFAWQLVSICRKCHERYHQQ